MKFACLIFLLSLELLARPGVGYAQLANPMDLGYTPEAKSQDELDLYLEVLTSPDPRTRNKNGQRFESQFPKSELISAVFQKLMLDYQELNDSAGVIKTGEKILQFSPDNLNTLLTLALVMSKGATGQPDTAEILQRADNYARRALKVIQQMRISRRISLERWRVLKGEMEAQAHEALGHVAVKSGRFKTAVSEFEIAVLHSPTPQGSYFFYLGMAYALTHQDDQAEKALRRAEELGPEQVRELARSEIEKLGVKKSH